MSGNKKLEATIGGIKLQRRIKIVDEGICQPIKLAHDDKGKEGWRWWLE